MQQKIYVFGNPDYQMDATALLVSEQLAPQFPQIQFIFIKPNQDLPFENVNRVLILDTVMGIKDIIIVNETNIDKIQLPPRFSAHDFDLGFQLKYLTKLGKLKSFTIMCLPMGQDIEFEKIKLYISQLIADF